MAKGKKDAAMKDGHIKLPFKTALKLVSANTTGFQGGFVDLSPTNIGARVSSMQAYFRRWRFCAPLHVREFLDLISVVFWAVDNSTPSDNTVGNQGLTHGVGFYGADTGASTAGPTSTLDIVEQFTSDWGPSQQINKITIPLTQLRSAQLAPWNMTHTTGTNPLAATVAGAIWVGFNTEQGFPEGYPVHLWIVIKGEIEFADPIDSDDAMLGRLRPAPRVLANPMLITRSGRRIDDDDHKSEVLVEKQ